MTANSKILDCGWAVNMMFPTEMKARAVLKYNALTDVDHLSTPTPTSVTVRCFVVARHVVESEVSTSDVRVAFMRATASEPNYGKPNSNKEYFDDDDVAFRTSPAAQCDPYCQTPAICSVSCTTQAKL